MTKTIEFKGKGGEPFNGLNPRLLNGDNSVLGNSFDPEGIVVGQGGHMYVSDEYGPSVYEFTSTGQFIRAFTRPDNLLPRVSSALDFFADPPETGRQGNRGYEGLAINPMKTKLYAILQDPLQEEGDGPRNPGRRSRNVRIVEYDIKSGKSERQFIYQLDTIAEINARDHLATQFTATAQGRNIGASGIYAISDTEFLVLERENRAPWRRRGDHASGCARKATAQAHLQDRHLGRWTTSPMSVFAGTNDDLDELRAGDEGAVPRSPHRDRRSGPLGAEKIEGFAVGPLLPNGHRLFIGGTDNDYSVTQTGAGDEFDVCIDASMTTWTRVALGAACPPGKALIPALLMSFTGELD